jgi:UDP-N-acetyl-D-glucosamine dehydrogenase
MSYTLETLSQNQISHSALSELYQKLQSQEAVLGIVGLGYVGLPLAVASITHHVKTIGFDLSQDKIDLLKQKKSYLRGISDKQVCLMMETDLFTPTRTACDLKQADFILLCVPTPLTKNHTPDMSYIETACEMIAKILRRGQVIILESTTYPGTTTELMTPILEKSGLVCGYDFFVAYSPEREDPGNQSFSTHTIPKVVGADTSELCDIVADFYGRFIKKVVKVSSTKTAEAVKLLENIFRYVNIGLVNELKMVFDDMGIDMNEVVAAAATKPFGFMPFYPGPGIGGHCIPIDPLYLTWKSHEYKSSTRFIKVAMEINQKMPVYTVQKFSELLNDRKAKALKGAKVLLVGLAYKKNIDDLRESPASDIMELLHKRGADIYFYDPYVGDIKNTEFEHLKRAEWTKENLLKMDGAIIITDHDGIDWKILQDNCLVYDTRNVLSA